MFFRNCVLFSYNLKFVYNLTQSLKYSTNNKIKTIEFKTCGQLYEELKKKNPKVYQNSPSDGLTVNVEYVDTFADRSHKISSDVKTILAIHGIPGYYHHFNELIKYFNEEPRVRVIVPNMPDFSLTRKTMAFWHSNEERTQFIRDFLNAINVSTIDCLISHSAGIHPISQIWSNPKELKIGSIGLFCPQPLWLSKYFFSLTQMFSLMTRSEFGIKFMDAIKPNLIAHKMGYPMSYENVDEVLLTVVFGANALDRHKLHQRLEYLKNNQIKTLVVYGQRDKLIVKENFKRLIRDLGADKKDFVVYSKNDSIEREADPQSQVRVLSFRNGGHFAFAKYAEEVNKHLVKHCLQF